VKPFYSASEMAVRLQRARQLGFRFPKGSERLPISTWCEVANGVGPGAWSRTARKISTWIQPFASLAADHHDLAYCTPCKDKAHFDTANGNFYFNICQDIRANTWRISLIRVLALRAAWIEYQAVHLGGWDAFVTGHTIPELDGRHDIGKP
jgi:hypothetical protein